MDDVLEIRASEVLADIRSAAWLEQEIHPELDRHRRHQMADICEDGNVERVWRVLGNGVAEIRLTLQCVLLPENEVGTVNELDRPDSWNFSFLFPMPAASMAFIREKIHEYLMAAVMAERAGVIIPGCAGIWRARSEEALAALRLCAATASATQKPVRRPLWPL